MEVAIANGDSKAVDDLLVEEKEKSWKLIKEAVSKGNIETMDKLIKFNLSQIMYEEPSDSTLLHCAASHGDSEICKLLLGREFSVDAVNDENETPIHVAFKANQLLIVNILLEKLLEKQELSDIKDNDGLSLFFIACASSKAQRVSDFLNRCPSISINTISSIARCDRSALQMAAIYCRYDVVSFLMDKGADLNARSSTGLTILHYLCFIENFCWLKYLFQSASSYADFLVNLKEVMSCRFDVINKLLQSEFDVDARDTDGNNALMLLTKNWYVPPVKICIDSCRNIFRDESIDIVTLNHIIEANRILIIKKLLIEYNRDMQLNINSDFENISKPLKGVNLTNKDGSTCLHHLAKTGNLEYTMYQFFQNVGADVAVRNNALETPIHVAAGSGNITFLLDFLIESLVNEQNWEKMAHIDAQDENGNTPLHRTIYEMPDYGMSQMCMCILLNLGADPTIRNKEDVTPLMMVNGIYLDLDNEESMAALKVDEIKLEVENVADLKERLFTELEGNRNFVLQVVVESCKFLAKAVQAHNCTIEELGMYMIIAQELFFHSEKSTINFKEYNKSCLSEVKKMKETRTSQQVSLYDLLVRDMNIIASYTDNSELKHLLESEYVAENFPIYYNTLRARFVSGIARKSILELANLALQKMLVRHLPNECISYITQHLSEKELRDVAAAGFIPVENIVKDKVMMEVE